MVDKELAVTMDDFPSWVALKKEMLNLQTKKSENGSAFKKMHKQIMLVKMWRRGIHHKCFKKFLQGYTLLLNCSGAAKSFDAKC